MTRSLMKTLFLATALGISLNQAAAQQHPTATQPHKTKAPDKGVVDSTVLETGFVVKSTRPVTAKFGTQKVLQGDLADKTISMDPPNYATFKKDRRYQKLLTDMTQNVKQDSVNASYLYWSIVEPNLTPVLIGDGYKTRSPHVQKTFRATIEENPTNIHKAAATVLGKPTEVHFQIRYEENELKSAKHDRTTKDSVASAIQAIVARRQQRKVDTSKVVQTKTVERTGDEDYINPPPAPQPKKPQP